MHTCPSAPRNSDKEHLPRRWKGVRPGTPAVALALYLAARLPPLLSMPLPGIFPLRLTPFPTPPLLPLRFAPKTAHVEISASVHKP